MSTFLKDFNYMEKITNEKRRYNKPEAHTKNIVNEHNCM